MHLMRQRRHGDPTLKRKPKPKRPRATADSDVFRELLALREEVASLRSRLNALEQQAAGTTRTTPDTSKDRTPSEAIPDRRTRPPMDFIDRLEPEFRFARTLAHIPHYWVRRTPENEADYTALYRAIEKYGRWGLWAKSGRWYKYLYHGNYKYWSMGSLAQSRIINSAKAEPEDKAPELPFGDDTGR